MPPRGSFKKLPITSRLVISRSVDDPWNSGPVSSYSEYSDNDVTDGQNEIMQYGINS